MLRCIARHRVQRDTFLVPAVRTLAFSGKWKNSAPELTDDSAPVLPRYLRRRHLGKSVVPQTPEKDPSSSSRVYRSKHFDTAQPKKDNSEIKFLEPHVLSARLKKLCDANKIDDAVTMLKNAPLDAQNTPVWNTLIWECMKAHRFKLGYQLFVDMKRRGFSPTTRTFQTMFTGLSRIQNWTTYTKQLTNVRSIYESYQKHIASVKKEDNNSPELSVQPLTGYIKILGDAGCYQEVFDVYHALDAEGPLAADQFIYTAVFQALARKPDSGSARDVALICLQNATTAKHLWTQMQKSLQKKPFEIDAFVVTSAISALSGGREPEQTLAFAVIHEYYGLAPPGQSPTKARIALAPQSIATIFLLCNASKKYDFAHEYFQQIKGRSEGSGGVTLLDRPHLEEVLKARLASPEPGVAHYCLETLEWMLRQEIVGKNGPKIRPALSTYNLVLTACWRDAEWKSALRVFELMTGYYAHDFMDGSVSRPPRINNRGPGRNLVPTPETLSSMARTALATRDHANVRQALRILDYLDVGSLFISHQKVEETNKAAKSKQFFTSKLADAVTDAVNYVSEVPAKSSAAREEAKRWSILATHAKIMSTKTQQLDALST